jgi:hypothetical protein
MFAKVTMTSAYILRKLHRVNIDPRWNLREVRLLVLISWFKKKVNMTLWKRIELLSGSQKTLSQKVLIYVYREPHCMSPRRNWDSFNPSPASECALPPRPKGGGHTRLRLRGWGDPIPKTDWRKSLALCLLCALSPFPWSHMTLMKVKDFVTGS